ncbi:MAG: DnaJ domain-containing protein [Planctomycetes bacterium]|nr:DnaJ domain-containing protein [Planctomycetota bacterium]
MAWGWKVAGVTIGAALGGPLGAAVGTAIGHALDKGAEKTGRESSDAPESSPAVGVLYSVAVFLAHIAKADGFVDPREVKLIRDVLLELNQEIQGGLNRDERERLASHALSSNEGIETLLFEARRSEDLRIALLRYAWRVAAKDGTISSDELRWIVSVGLEMGFNHDELRWASVPYYRPAKEDERRLAAAQSLGLTVDASSEEVKSVYRSLALKYHPDRHPTVSSELKQLATEKFAAISDAYRLLSEPNEKPLLYGLACDVDMVSTVRNGDVVRCLFCTLKSRLPEARHHDSARCPKCQCLLLFASDIAEVLLGMRHGGLLP